MTRAREANTLSASRTASNTDGNKTVVDSSSRTFPQPSSSQVSPSQAFSQSSSYSRSTFILAFTAVCLIWGSTYLGVRFAIETLPPLLMAGVRFTVAGIIMLIWARFSGASYPTWQETRAAIVVGFMLVSACNGMFTIAMGRVPSSIGALVATSLPIWMVLLDWLRPQGKRPANGVFAGVVLGFGGIVMLVQPWKYFMNEANNSQHFDFIGFVLMFFGTIAWAVGSIYARQTKLPDSPRMTTAIELLAGGLIMLVLAVIIGDVGRVHLQNVSLKSFLAFLYLIAFGSIAAFSAYAWLLQNVSTALASSYTYINPIIALLLGATLGGESITPAMITAMMIILAAVGLIAKYRSADIRS